MKTRSRERWKATNGCEIKLLLDILFLQGIVQKPRNAMFFFRKKLIPAPTFYEMMTEERFFLLLKFLHFNDNSQYNSRTDKTCF
jgi:hypothetical protein